MHSCTDLQYSSILGSKPIPHMLLLLQVRASVEYRCHEDMSVELIDLIAEDSGEDWEASMGLSTEDFEIIKDLVCGTPGALAWLTALAFSCLHAHHPNSQLY
jgi:hypothetical protein